MKIIINHNENITPEESVEFVSNLVHSKGLDTLIKQCSEGAYGIGWIYTWPHAPGVVAWAKLNKASLTFQVNREYHYTKEDEK